MNRRYSRFVLLIIPLGYLCGCAAITFSEIQAAAPSVEACLKPDGIPATEAAVAAAAKAASVQAEAASGHLHFQDLMQPLARSGELSVRIQMPAPTPGKSEFQQYVEQVNARANSSVPAELQLDPVFAAVRDTIIKATATASMQRQLATAKALNLPIAQSDIDEVNAFKPKQSVSHGNLKTFAQLMTSFALHPVMNAHVDAKITPSIAGQAPPGASSTAFSKYFHAYYSNTFYDRLGVLVSKPAISLTVTDAEIGSALTMLIEYTADLFDPTPVMTNGGNYFPGNNNNQPTALAAQLAVSVPIGSDSGCDWNTNDAPVLGDIANAAADQASAVSGLVTGTFGGWEVGLGFLGKFSLGDNKTLSTIATTFASRIAERATLATVYWALDKAKHSAMSTTSPEALVTYRVSK